MYRKMLMCITLALQFFICESKLEPLSTYQMNISKSLSQCITTTSKRFFSKDFETITISLPLLEPNVSSLIPLDIFTLPELSTLENAGMMIIKLTSLDKAWEKIKTMIIHFKNKKDLLDHLSKLKHKKLLNSYAKYLLVSTDIFEDPFLVARKVSEYMWNEDVINFVVMIPHTTNSTEFIVYTWNPYNNSCGTNFSNSSHSKDYCSFGEIQSDTNWFGEKIPRKLFNCTVTARYWPFPPYVIVDKNNVSGIEINLLELIGDQLNFTLSHNANEMNVSERLDLKAPLGFLKKNNTDIFFGGIPKISKISQLLPTSESYMHDTFIWCVPNEPLENDLENFVSVISYIVVFLTLLVHAVISFSIWYLSNEAISETALFKNFFSVYFYTYGYLSGSNVPRQPRTVKVRYFLALFLLFCFILTSFYSSLLTRNITRPQFKEKYTSMQDIYDNNLNTYFVPEQKLFFRVDLYSVPLSEIMKRWQNCFDIDVCLKHVSVDMNSSICLSRLYKSFIIGNHTIESIYCLKKDSISYPVTIVMREGFLLQNRFNEILVKLFTGGFIAKWENDFVKEINKPLNQHIVRINLKNLRPVFQLHFLLLTVAFLIFIVEKLYATNHNILNP